MMMEVEITNYQSIAHAKLVIDGFTTLVGRNTLGKSSVLRAINAALTNQQGTDFIRWGESFCEVRIKMEGLNILWHKEENNNFYQINDGPIRTKIGKEEPPKEIVDFGFKLLKIGSQKINLNYADQFNPLFLVDKMDSKGADLLTSVYGLDRLYKAIDLCSKEQRDNRDELRLREKDLEIVKRDIDRFRGFESIKQASDSLSVKKKVIDKEELDLSSLKEKSGKAYELASACKRLSVVHGITTPESASIQKAVVEYAKLVSYNADTTANTTTVKRLEKVSEIKSPSAKIAGISTAVEAFRALCDMRLRYDKLSKEVEVLSEIETVTIPAPVIDTQILSKLRDYFREAMAQKKDLIATDAELKSVVGRLEAANSDLSEFEVCPLCGKARKQ
jgi:predicted ATP-dependent endonuclease of OLD family